MSETQKLTAAQRLEGLEKASMILDQTIRGMMKTQEMLIQTVKVLGNKMDSIVKATQRGEELNDDTLSAIMVENNVKELQDKVNNMVTAGLLEESTSGVIEENSFVVGRELEEIDVDGNKTQKVTNPRLQVAVAALANEGKEAILGKKVGDVAVFGDGKMQFEINSVYSIVANPQ